MILYGRNAVLEALRGRRRVARVWLADRRDLQRLPEAIQTEVTDASRLEELCGSPQHQGLVCEAETYPYADAGSLLDREPTLVVALDQIQDPQNLGAICRTAEGGGAAGVVIPERRAAHITPAVCRASAGAIEHLRVARVGNLVDYLTGAKERGAWVYGAEAGAPIDYREPDYSGRVVLVLGSEGAGLRARVAQACDQLVSLPLRGRIGSLNVSAAAALLIYEVARVQSG